MQEKLKEANIPELLLIILNIAAMKGWLADQNANYNLIHKYVIAIWL